MPAPGLCRREGRLHRKAPPPGFRPRLRACDEFVERDRAVARPQASRRAEIRNPAFGRNAGAGEGDDGGGGCDHVAEPFHAAAKVCCNHWGQSGNLAALIIIARPAGLRRRGRRSSASAGVSRRASGRPGDGIPRPRRSSGSSAFFCIALPGPGDRRGEPGISSKACRTATAFPARPRVRPAAPRPFPANFSIVVVAQRRELFDAKCSPDRSSPCTASRFPFGYREGAQATRTRPALSTAKLAPKNFSASCTTITIRQRLLRIRAPIATANAHGTRIKGMGMSEQPDSAAAEREEIVARIAHFKATQQKFEREREEFFRHHARKRAACRTSSAADIGAAAVLVVSGDAGRVTASAGWAKRKRAFAHLRICHSQSPHYGHRSATGRPMRRARNPYRSNGIWIASRIAPRNDSGTQLRDLAACFRARFAFWSGSL